MRIATASFTLLGSSSAGNSCLVTCEGSEGRSDLLIDAGLPPNLLEERLSRAGGSWSTLSAVFFTHGHIDHVRSARLVARRSRARLLAPAGALRAVQGLALRTVEPATPPPLLAPPGAGLPATEVGPFTVTPFRVPHDFPDTVGYRVAVAGRTLAYATDVGCPTPRVEEALRGADAVVLEANHDPDLLAKGPYPPHLKARISGGMGHLANPYAAALLSSAVAAGAGPGRIVLAHLSETNNRPDRAVGAVRERLPSFLPVDAAPARHPSETWTL